MAEVNKPKILLIEDNYESRYLIQYFLDKSGFIIETAEDGIKGVELAISFQPHLILLDMMLPIKDGFQVARELRSHEVTQHIPIIAFTANTLKEDVEKFFEAGCASLISKPIDLDRLLDQLEELLTLNPDAPVYQRSTHFD